MATTTHKPRRSSTKRRGASAVEFAIVAQVAFLLVLACFEFCRLNMIRNLTQDAAYSAARECMVPGATEAEATAAANTVLASMGTIGATVIINDGNGIDEQSDEIFVDVLVPIEENAVLIPMFTGDVDFTATANMRTERYDGFYQPQ